MAVRTVTNNNERSSTVLGQKEILGAEHFPLTPLCFSSQNVYRSISLMYIQHSTLTEIDLFNHLIY